ncbi:hypothetical protein E4U53_005417 [Claviceps sorghi]|nr:hypothetical protein E4U53_005417 [Claviceps sorghi]
MPPDAEGGEAAYPLGEEHRTHGPMAIVRDISPPSVTVSTVRFIVPCWTQSDSQTRVGRVGRAASQPRQHQRNPADAAALTPARVVPATSLDAADEAATENQHRRSETDADRSMFAATMSA